MPAPRAEPPSDGRREAFDARVRSLLAQGRVDETTELVLREYGGELLGFLHGTMSHPQDADDAFSLLAAALWRSLPSFEWRSSLRTWLYVLARRAMSRVHRGQSRDELLPRPSAIDRLVDETRATSLPQLAAVREGLAGLRARLEPDDQILLVLRVDRELPWRDIAEVLADDGVDPDRLSASLRKRFERIKARIRALAHEAGLA